MQSLGCRHIGVEFVSEGGVVSVGRAGWVRWGVRWGGGVVLTGRVEGVLLLDIDEGGEAVWLLVVVGDVLVEPVELGGE